MKLNIQIKLFLLLAGLTSVILVAVLIAINTVFEETITDNVISDFRQTQGFFKSRQSLVYDRLVESAYLVQNNSNFKANVNLNDAETVYYEVEQIAQSLKVDLFVVTNAKGELLTWLGKPDSSGVDLSNQPSISRALKGEEPPLNIEWPELWYTNGSLYQIVSVPVYQGGQIGTITLGSMLTQVEARELKQNTELDVVLFYNNQPFVSSKEDLNPARYQQFVSRNQSLIDSVRTNNAISEPFQAQIAGNRHFAFISPLGRGEPAYYLASVPETQKLSMLYTIREDILYIGIISLLVTIPIAIAIGRFFAKPINRLSGAMSRVRKGDLNVSVTATTEDEIGMLTQTFNEMIGGLRERFTLQKYVGEHTLKMIQSDPHQNGMPTSTRKELAILFTDIRNSTKTIEQKEPEHFITRLNSSMGFQSEYVAQFKGSVDKYIGDSMVALFEGQDALDRAIKCGIAIQKCFKQGNKKDPFFNGLGIGINYGPMVLGNMGAGNRLDYTVIGPEVNLCARLCSAAGAGQILTPKNILLNHNLESHFSFQYFGSQKFKGFSNEMEIVEVEYD